jgi:hypothetical protein
VVALDVQVIAHFDGSLGASCNAKAATLAQVRINSDEAFLQRLVSSELITTY